MHIAEFVEGWNSILQMGKTETNKLSIEETENNTSSMIRVFSKPLKAIKKKCREKKSGDQTWNCYLSCCCGNCVDVGASADDAGCSCCYDVDCGSGAGGIGCSQGLLGSAASEERQTCSIRIVYFIL